MSEPLGHVPRPSGKGTHTAFRVSLAVAALAFGAYLALITYCDIAAPETLGGRLIAVASGALVQTVNPEMPLGRADLQPGDLLLRIDGRPVAKPLDWEGVFTRIEIGQPMPVSFVRNGVEQQTSLTFAWRAEPLWASTRGELILFSRAVQAVTLLFAVMLAFRGAGAPALVGALLLATIAVFSVGLPPRLATLWRQVPAPLSLLFFGPATVPVLIGGALFAFFSVLLRLRPSKTVVIACALPFLPILAWRLAFLWGLVYQPQWIAALTGALAPVTVVNFLYVMAAVGAIVWNYPRVSDVSERRRLRWVLAGSTLGCCAAAPTLTGLWLGMADDATAMYTGPVPMQLGYSLFLVMPVSLWWAIARHRLFDINFVVRRSLQYVFARRALLVVSPLIVVALLVEGSLHPGDALGQLIRRHAFLYGGTLAALALFHSQRADWLDALDRRLFRERYDACQLLRQVVRQVRTTNELTAASAFAVQQVSAALHPEWLALYGPEAEAGRLTLRAGAGPIEPSWPAQSVLMDFVRSLRRPLEIDLTAGSWLCEHLPAGEVAILRRAGVALVVPVRVEQSGREIVFAFGAKQSGEPYSREDKNLLEAVGESLADLEVSAVWPSEGEAAEAETPWEQHLLLLADVVSRGAAVDWTAELQAAAGERERQELLQLRTLEELMAIPGGVGEAAGALSTAPRDLRPRPTEVDTQSMYWGTFELRRRIGSGSFGSVYRAWDAALEREVAVKILDADRPDRSALLAEARHLARVRHQNVVHVYGAAEIEGAAGFWMELIEGETLAERLREHGTYGADEAAAVGVAMCRALSAIHRAGLVHQDVKAQNVMREDGGRLVLMDLGAGVSSRARTVPRWGTPAYMAPELFVSGSASVRSDIYSLGVLLFHLTTGTFPSSGRNFDEIASCHREGECRRLRDLRPDLPEEFLAAIDQALASDPLQRFATAGELAAAVRVVES